MQNGTAQADRKFQDFTEFCTFFTFTQKWAFVQSSSLELRFVAIFEIFLDLYMHIFLETGDAQSQKLSKFQIPTKSPF